MSTPKENVIFRTENVLCGICFIVQRERLGDLIKRVREEKKFSLQDVRQKSGRQLAASYVSRIENNQISPESISVGKLKSLAKGIEIPEGQLFDLVRGVRNGTLSSEHAELIEIVKDLNRMRVDDLLHLARIFYSAQKGGNDWNANNDRVEPAATARVSLGGEISDETKARPKKKVAR